MGRRGLASAVNAVSALLLVLGVATFAYSQWAEWQYLRRQPPGPREALAAQLDVRAPATPEGAAGSSPPPTTSPFAADGGRAPTGAAQGSASVDGSIASLSSSAGGASGAAAWPPRASSYGRSERMVIPRIGVDSEITEVGVSGGEYEVPAWSVGHHADSAAPGESGNSVFNGHLESIQAGRVFGRLEELKAGDAVYVYTGTHRLDWAVYQVHMLPNTERDFMSTHGAVRLTAYTCTGTWSPLTRDYSHRLVVVAALVNVTPRT